jgi:hypothetical protein
MRLGRLILGGINGWICGEGKLNGEILRGLRRA